jgi:CheY-like chemotaxis protein
MEMSMAYLSGCETPTRRPLRSPATSDAGLEVLVVEDDEADAYLIRGALRQNPQVFSIALARDGVEAMELLNSGTVLPDVAIIDLHMPRKSGFALLLEMRCRPQFDFPAIVLTSSMVQEDRFRAKLRGADCVLTKPDSNEELEWMLSDAIANI